MPRAISSTILKVLYAYSFAALVIGGSTCAYFLSIYAKHWGIKAGCKPDNSCNMAFFMNFAAIGFCIILFLYAIVELLMLFNIEKIKRFDISYIKAIIYIIAGICLLGLCGDLGIAAGSLMLAAGAFWLALLLYTL